MKARARSSRGSSGSASTWDENVVYQGANVARHYADAHRLLTSGAAYRDFTPPAEIERLRNEAEARGDSFRFDRRWPS